MHSNRTFGHELINDEGKQTWNISDGMTYLYNTDREQYSGGYWASVDPKRLAGTTTEYVTRPDGAGSWTKNLYAWVGGSTVGNFGVAGMHFKTLGNTGDERSGTDAKKSWFFFDDEIVAVGSGITFQTGNMVETIVENRKLNTEGSNRIIADGRELELREETLLSEISWISLEGSQKGSDIGYYFPKKSDIMEGKAYRKLEQSGTGGRRGNESFRRNLVCAWQKSGECSLRICYPARKRCGGDEALR